MILIANHLGLSASSAREALSCVSEKDGEAIISYLEEKSSPPGGIENFESALGPDVDTALKRIIGRAIIKADKSALDSAKGEIEACKAENIGFSAYGGSTYPARLLKLQDPPPIIYYKGNLSCLGKKTAGIVGTRAPHESSMKLAYGLAKELASSGITIVSGLAEGIDTSAHLGALASNASTVGVMGNGLSECVFFPKSNIKMAEAMVASGGAVLSELPPVTRAQKWTFPRRNRIIAALSDCLIAVEASSTSGTMITVEQAKKLGVKVFAPARKLIGADNSGIEAALENGTAARFLNAGEVRAYLDSKAAPLSKTQGSSKAPPESETQANSKSALEPKPRSGAKPAHKKSVPKKSKGAEKCKTLDEFD